jgi:hypothetical protein
MNGVENILCVRAFDGMLAAAQSIKDPLNKHHENI